MPIRLSRASCFVAPLLVLAASCADVRTGAPPAHSTALPNGDSAAEPAGSVAGPAPSAVAAPPPAPDAPHVAAVRAERWADAAKLIDALDGPTKGTAETRFLRARVAIALGDDKAVAPLLDGIVLPGFEDDIARLKAQAAVDVGPYPEAAQYYESRGKVKDLLLAAKARQKAGDPKAALALADRALAQAQRLAKSGDERAAHGVRVDLLTIAGKVDEAMTDLKWLAVKAPASSEGRSARKILADKKVALSKKETIDSIDALIDGGAPKDALEELDRVGAGISKPELLRLKAEALFKARQYQKASDAYLAASKVESGATAEEIYYAGRALARIKKEDQAIARYREVMKRFRKEPWAERAAFQLAQLYLTGGKYTEAAEAFTDYLAKFPKGASRDDASYSLALAYLSSGEPAKARRVFNQMASTAKKTDVGVLRELEGVAALRAGAKEDAAKLFAQVAKDQPLTWAASMSRSRLSAMGEALPPIIEPASAQKASPIGAVLPAKVKKLVELGLDADAEALLSENEASASAAYGGRESEALCAMYGSLSRAKRRYKVGSAAVSFETLMRAPSEADRWSWECVYPSPYSDMVTGFEKDYALPTGLMHAIMRQESAFDPDAVSSVGAQGLMQLMPTTAEQAAKESSFPYDPTLIRSPEPNLKIGGFYLSKLAKSFDGSLPLAIASYNAGPGAVARWVETSKDLESDVWVARIPYEETRNYVGRVMSNLARYQWLRGGDAAVAAVPLELPAHVHPKDEDY